VNRIHFKQGGQHKIKHINIKHNPFFESKIIVFESEINVCECKIYVFYSYADDFQKFHGSPGTQPQSSQGRQQKKQRNQTQNLVMPFQTSDIATSRPIEVGSA
jgi:hypothetical protein